MHRRGILSNGIVHCHSPPLTSITQWYCSKESVPSKHSWVIPCTTRTVWLLTCLPTISSTFVCPHRLRDSPLTAITGHCDALSYLPPAISFHTVSCNRVTEDPVSTNIRVGCLSTIPCSVNVHATADVYLTDLSFLPSLDRSCR